MFYYFSFSIFNDKQKIKSQKQIQKTNKVKAERAKDIFAFIIYLSTAISHSIINCFNPLCDASASVCSCSRSLYRNQRSIKFNFSASHCDCVCYCQTLINCQRDKNENCFMFHYENLSLLGAEMLNTIKKRRRREIIMKR